MDQLEPQEGKLRGDDVDAVGGRGDDFCEAAGGDHLGMFAELALEPPDEPLDETRKPEHQPRLHGVDRVLPDALRGRDELDLEELGRSGRLPGTRALVIPNTPLIAAYTVEGFTVWISRVLHSARKRPDRY